MEREKMAAFLRKYNFSYTESGAEICVNLDFQQKVYLDFSEAGRVKIKDRLVGWNFLTGMIPMSLKSAMIYNFIGLLAFGFIFFFVQLHDSKANFTVPCLVLGLWVALFSIFYLVRLEAFRQTIFRITG